jgi:hypothetical protein
LRRPHASRPKGICEMRLLHSAANTSAQFDDPNLVSCAGLVPVMRLAQRCDLAGLVHLDERFFAGCLSPGASEDGGRDDVEESRPKRRSSSTIRSACSAITHRCCSTTDSSSRTRPSNRSTTASNDPEPTTPRSSQATTSAPVATRRNHQPAEQLRLYTNRVRSAPNMSICNLCHTYFVLIRDSLS